MKIQYKNAGIAVKKRMMRRNLIIVNALKLMKADLEMKKHATTDKLQREWFNETINLTRHILEEYKNRI